MTTPAISLLRELLSGRPNAQTQRVIVDLLVRADAEQLSEMLADPKLTDRLVGVMSAGRFGPSHYDDLM